MKKINLKTLLKIKTPQNKDKQKSVELWVYGYYACSSLSMTPTINLSQNNTTTNHF